MTSTFRFAVRLTPRGGLDGVEGVVDGVLHVRVAAAAVDGAANQALVRLLADELHIGRSAVQIVAGATGRRKLILVDAAPERVLARWPGLTI